jgi:hypothetical protein
MIGPLLGALSPHRGVGVMSQYLQNFGALHLHEVEERVQTHGILVNDVDVERAKAVRGIKAGLPHGPITFVKQGRKLAGSAIIILIYVVVVYLVPFEVLLHQFVMRVALSIALGGTTSGAGPWFRPLA